MTYHKQTLRENDLLVMPEAGVTCPECGKWHHASEIAFVVDIGFCRNCALLEPAVRKYQH